MPRRSPVVGLAALLTSVLVLAGLAGVAGLTGSAATAAPVHAVPAVRAAPAAPAARTGLSPWRGCGGMQCATLTVPLDPARPQGRTVALAVSRVRHTRTPFRGAVFTNPGGPGGSGTYLAGLGRYVPRGVGKTYDWYGIDPRGVGASSPRLTCDGHYFGVDRPDYHPVGPRSVRYWQHHTRGYARSCASSSARGLLPHLSTRDNVADLEALRRAIGQQKITYYGFSYGTYLGEVYATLHPHRIKAMVLDGVIDPTRVFYGSNLDQDRAFQVSIEKFFAWVARHDSAYHLGHSERAVYRTYTDERARLARRAAGGKVGPDELDDALLPAGYYNPTWPQVASAFSALVRRDRPRGVLSLYRSGNPTGAGSDNAYAVYLATECTDASWPARTATYRRDNTRVDRRAPFYTWANAQYNQPCQHWAAPSRHRVTVTGRGLRAPVLLTAEQYDGATPFSGALAVRRTWPTARLVEGVGGTSHAVSLSGVACTDDAVADLLAHRSPLRRAGGNRADKRCRPLPPPSPDAGRGVASTPSRGPGGRPGRPGRP